jgi:hypothetical protein
MRLPFFRRAPDPILLRCLRCMHSTEITGPEDVPMNCPSCGAEFGSRRTEPTGIITLPGALTSDAVDRIRSRWDAAAREECS